MDGIQPYSGSSRTSGAPATPPNPTLTKVPADYLRALRRRIWLIVSIGVPLSVTASVISVRQPSIYQAKAEIMIEAPEYDPVLSTLVSHEIGRRDPEAQEKYVPNRAAQLRSRVLAEKVVTDPSIARAGAGNDEAAAQELIASIQTRQIPNTNHFLVTLEGTDPPRTARTLYTLLDLFQKQAEKEIQIKIEDSKQYAVASLNKLKQELKDLDLEIYATLRNSKTIGPGGKSILEEEYVGAETSIAHMKERLRELQQQAFITQFFPTARSQFGGAPNAARIADLEQLREELADKLLQFKRRIKHFDSDPSVRNTAEKLASVQERLERLRATPADEAGDPAESVMATVRDEVRAEQARAKTLLKELQDSMPDHQKFLTFLEERKQKMTRISTMQEKITEFDMLSRSQKNPISVPPTVSEPTMPVRPKRAMNIAIGLFLSFGLGVGLVCLLEYLDHSVKVPEHLTLGLTLPLFGVIPRIRRTALTHRGGHLWTPGAPDSIEADAYRNLRASLLGVSDTHGPIVTLLVTSAKAGEGKSTTALNLAATCARAGERTLLMDVDLRRPSLAVVFHQDEKHVGLVDVLRGDLPWQRTVVRTDIPNLDFISTGDTRDIPIEVLGTLELRQLIIALSSHYDRVILDGPAILGMADCRMLGRLVDASLLVVRSGAHELRPLQRAKSMLEQSRVVIAGVVFNALFEDLDNWSSYGPNTPYGSPESSGGPRRSLGPAGGRTAGSAGNDDEHEHTALPAVATFQA